MRKWTEEKNAIVVPSGGHFAIVVKDWLKEAFVMISIKTPVLPLPRSYNAYLIDIFPVKCGARPKMHTVKKRESRGDGALGGGWGEYLGALGPRRFVNGRANGKSQHATIWTTPGDTHRNF